MKIVVLNGSPRPSGNTAAHIEAFVKGVSGEHQVCVLPVGKMDIAPCKACDYCHSKGNGECIQRDDMAKVQRELADADMVVFATPIYYHGPSGQMHNLITRFYNIVKLKASKYALFLSSGAPGVTDAAVWQYKKNVEYFGGEDLGIFWAYGKENKSEEFCKKLEKFGASL